ncbi:hypothetical protein JXA88_00635 [Candidatus Fermentibacteria bacterium]|nr:hypothetical protein [Candidatus Fermentibacteria bacterium]
MSAVLDDVQIQRLIEEPKPLPMDYERRIVLKSKRGHMEAELAITGQAGSEFKLILRQSSHNPFDFSVILAHRLPNVNTLFRLRRYNGKHGPHTNRLERETFYDYHIHEATERYQEQGLDEDWFATPTERFSDLRSALRCMIDDCAFVEPCGTQIELPLEG